MSNINYKPLLLYLGFRTKEIVKKRKRLNLNNAGELKKVSLFESFYHNDSKWIKNKELNQLSQTSNNENVEKKKKNKERSINYACFNT